MRPPFHLEQRRIVADTLSSSLAVNGNRATLLSSAPRLMILGRTETSLVAYEKTLKLTVTGSDVVETSRTSVEFVEGLRRRVHGIELARDPELCSLFGVAYLEEKAAFKREFFFPRFVFPVVIKPCSPRLQSVPSRLFKFSTPTPTLSSWSSRSSLNS